MRVEGDARAGLFADARRQPDAGVGEGALPLRDPPVVDAVGADDPARRAERGDFIAQAVGQWRGRVHEQVAVRSEEHTSELQSLMRSPYADFCLKKKKNQ